MAVGDPRELLGLLLAYIEGDVVARKIVLDWLEENEDPRRGAVEREEIDWNAVACAITGEEKMPSVWQFLPPRYPPRTNQILFQIACARVGADTTDDVRFAVQEARREWLRELFPEMDL